MLIGGIDCVSDRPISCQIHQSHMASLVASEAAIYSASLLLVATQDCFLDIHEIGALFNRKIYPLTDFRPVLVSMA